MLVPAVPTKEVQFRCDHSHRVRVSRLRQSACPQNERNATHCSQANSHIIHDMRSWQENAQMSECLVMKKPHVKTQHSPSACALVATGGCSVVSCRSHFAKTTNHCRLGLGAGCDIQQSNKNEHHNTSLLHKCITRMCALGRQVFDVHS